MVVLLHESKGLFTLVNFIENDTKKSSGAFIESGMPRRNVEDMHIMA